MTYETEPKKERNLKKNQNGSVVLQLQYTLQALLLNLKIDITRFSMKRLHSHTCIEFASGLRNQNHLSFHTDKDQHTVQSTAR